MFLTYGLRLAGLVSLAAIATACVIDSTDSHGSSRGGANVSGGTVGTPVGGSTPVSAVAPILVDVDTDKIMDAQPGQGVGVFIEYSAGGHWYVWWTCDTLVNPQGPLTCDFRVRASVAAGAIKIFRIDAPEGAVTSATNSTLLEARTTTGPEVHGMHFDTVPGAVLTLEAAIGEARDSKYFFFVQNGRVNGGYTGQLSNPLMLQGTTP